MFGFSMVQMVRTHASKLDQPLRETVLHLYKPFKWTPCFLHRFFEGRLKKSKKLRVIIEFKEDAVEAGIQSTKQLMKKSRKTNIKKHFSHINCCAADLTPAALEELLANGEHIRKIYLDRQVHALLDVATQSSHADEVVRNGTTLTGEGITVAVVDTGVYPHEDLDGRIRDFVDLVKQKTKPYDDNGHGTHCAGDVAGDGAASDGLYKGPAPKANIIGVKVLNKQGAGSLSTIIEGVEWCIQFNEDHPDDPIHIISMSLGGDAQRYDDEQDDPMVRAVNAAWDQGIVVCVAAGNSGPNSQTIASPAVSQKVITVGAYDDRNTPESSDDVVAPFSSRGPTVYGETKPDLLAPGVNIVSLRSPRSFLDKLDKSSRVDDVYTTLSGTSMATPICAGICALLLEHSPDLTPDEVKTLLKENTSKWSGEDPMIYGAGAIDAEKAIQE
ncbi:S8 family peptidase [Bacillus altitudinis]|uniref:S8 family peptidase n=1 Tax=Bacillus altitudinis TaxID=293387 RepID=UPI0020BE95F8|nr:S8 family peptidase [Bacillus altitudinis]